MTSRPTQIFGIGGRFFVDAWEHPRLQQHLLGLAGVEEPRVCLLATASGDSATSVEQFYRDLGRHRCRLTHLNMFAPHTDRFSEFFQRQDIIYVGGGATRNLVTIWRDWGVDSALREAWTAGVVLAGTSAGSICWFESCITDSLPQRLLPLQGLGFLAGSNCTHFSSRPDRPAEFRRYIASGDIASPGLALDDNVGVHFIDGKLHEVVAVRPDARAYRLERVAGAVIETEIPARLLT